MKQKNQKNKYENILRWKNERGFISQRSQNETNVHSFFSISDNPFIQDATEE